MLHVIEVGAEVDIDDSSLLFDDGLGDPVYRLMRCPFGSVSIRPRLEIGFKDRLQNELECSLNHPITDSWNRQNADLSPVLWNLLLPCPHGPIRVTDQFVPDPPQETFRSALLNGLKRDPVDSRCPVVAFRHPVSFVERFHLADVDVQPPETPSRFSLRLDV